MPKPGRRCGYQASAYVAPLVLMLTGGGRSVEDLRTLKNDTALRNILKQSALPSTNATGSWLRRTGAGEGLSGLDRINRRVVATRLRKTALTAHTLAGDASEIVAKKEAAQFTCKGEQGYMPMIGHLAEAGIVIFGEFREGNTATATRNLESIQGRDAHVPQRASHCPRSSGLGRLSGRHRQLLRRHRQDLRHRRTAGWVDATGHCRNPRRQLEELRRLRRCQGATPHERNQESVSSDCRQIQATGRTVR